MITSGINKGAEVIVKLVFAHDHFFYKINDQYYSNGSFSKEVLERYTNVFDEVVVVSRQKEITQYDDKLTLASTKNIRFVKIPNFKTIKSILRIVEAKKLIDQEIKNCDCLIARLPSSISTMAVKSAKKNNKPYLIEAVACPWALWNHSLLGKIVAPFSYLQMKYILLNSKYTIYVTNEFLQRRYPTRGKSVNCSDVSLKEFNDKVIEARLKKIDNIQKDSKIIIGTTAAVNVRYKGQQYVIKALGKLKKQGLSNFEYQLVGGGDTAYLKSIAKKNNVADQVKFLGSMPHNKVFEWLDEIDIYVQPSRQEGLPRALIEAMSRGLPAFGARTAGIPELLESQYTFSNTAKNINEICLILKRFDKRSMAEQAMRNYQESKKYDKDIIEKRRQEFMLEFKEYSKYHGDID